jgi:hypothetical protein
MRNNSDSPVHALLRTSIVMESHAMVKYFKRLRGGWG